MEKYFTYSTYVSINILYILYLMITKQIMYENKKYGAFILVIAFAFLPIINICLSICAIYDMISMLMYKLKNRGDRNV